MGGSPQDGGGGGEKGEVRGGGGGRGVRVPSAPAVRDCGGGKAAACPATAGAARHGATPRTAGCSWVAPASQTPKSRQCKSEL